MVLDCAMIVLMGLQRGLIKITRMTKMGLFDSWILQAILLDEAFDSLERLDKEDSDSDMQEIIHCSDCAHWKKSENANNVGDCTLRNEPMFRGDFCSKAEKKQEIKLTEQELVFAKALKSIQFDWVSYDAVFKRYTLHNSYFCGGIATEDFPFPTLKENIGDSRSIVLFFDTLKIERRKQ